MRKFHGFFLCLFFAFTLFGRQFELSMTDFGELPVSSSILRHSLSITNPFNEDVTLRFLSGCTCFEILPGTLTLGAKESRFIDIWFDTAGYTGVVEKHVLILSDYPSLPKQAVTFSFIIPAKEGGKDEIECKTCSEINQSIWEHQSLSLLANSVLIEYYYSAGCRSCTVFLNKEIPRLQEAVEEIIYLKSYDIMQGENYERLLKQADGLGLSTTELPVVFVDGVMLASEDKIQGLIESTVKAALEKRRTGSLLTQIDENTGGESKINSQGLAARMSPVSVFLAGLVDGVNPCVFTTLLFLLSTLALIGRNRKEILSIGLVFALSVFLTYFLAGLGFLSVLRTAAVFPVVASIIRWLLVSVLFVFALLSIYDSILITRGHTSKMLLQLPDKLKKNVHAAIRNKTRQSSLMAGTFAMGVMVSVFELACTGQIYLPTIAYMLQVSETFSTWLLLIIYNTAFIIPLLIVFFLVYAGTTSARLTRFFQENVLKMKISMAILFILLGILTLLL